MQPTLFSSVGRAAAKATNRGYFAISIAANVFSNQVLTTLDKQPANGDYEAISKYHKQFYFQYSILLGYKISIKIFTRHSFSPFWLGMVRS
jgi:hypothetical protein